MIRPRLIAQAPNGEIAQGGPPAMPLGVLFPAQFGGKFNGGALANGEVVFAPLVKVSGYNTFMVQIECAAGGTVRLEIGTYSIRTNYAIPLFYDVVIAAAAPPAARAHFGWATSVRPLDVWDQIEFVATGGGGIGVTDFFLTVYCGVR